MQSGHLFCPWEYGVVSLSAKKSIHPGTRALHGYADMNISMDISMNITDMNTGFFHG